MAVVPMQKISLLIHQGDKPDVLELLQNKGVLQITDVGEVDENMKKLDLDKEGHELEYRLAELDFAIQFLNKFEEKKKGLQAIIDGDSIKINTDELTKIAKEYEFADMVERCKSMEEEMVNLKNEIKSIKSLQEKLEPWSHLEFPLDTPSETDNTVSIYISMVARDCEALKLEVTGLSDLVVLTEEKIINDKYYAQIICDKSIFNQVTALIISHKAELIELPKLEGNVKGELKKSDARLEQINIRQEQLTKVAKDFSKELKNLRIVYDYSSWRLQQKLARRNFASTDSTVFIKGWMPKKSIDIITKDIESITKNFELSEIDPDEDESAPVLLQNKNFMKPFRSVTDVYGLPLYNEVDPTPFLAVFFIVYFGMCLTDAGYGIIMFICTWAVLRYLKIPKSMENLVRLLMYGGIMTFFAGILFGGWFGMLPDQAPAWMTTTTASGKILFKGQMFDPLGNAMQTLILSLGLGYFQTLFGVWLNFIHKFKNQNKKDALLDNFPWAYLLSVIGLYILVFAGILPQSLSKPVLYLTYIGLGLIVLTQGRKKSNIIAKFLIGILSLYNLVGYMSAVLSYSRLLALGLATTIIGLAANTIASLANGIPYVGIIFAIIILIIGHTFNLGINALGAFIHSGRLQFVEFFGNFMEGGGSAFKPLRRDSKYVQFTKIQ